MQLASSAVEVRLVIPSACMLAHHDAFTIVPACAHADRLANAALLVEIDTIVRIVGASYYSASDLPVSCCPPVGGQQTAGKRGGPALQRLCGAEPGLGRD